MSNIDAVTRTETPAPAPTTKDLTPPALQYTAQQASPAAAIDSVQADATKGNMMANMHGGWVPDKRGIVNIVTNAASRSKKKGAMSKTKSRYRSRSRTIRRGGRGRGRLSRRFRKQGSSFKHRVSRRIRLRLLQMRIKKRNIASASRSSRSNAKMQKPMRGGNTDAAVLGQNDLVPQHGASCSGDADPNCPGLAAESLLTANRQSTANAHGDSK